MPHKQCPDDAITQPSPAQTLSPCGPPTFESQPFRVTQPVTDDPRPLRNRLSFAWSIMRRPQSAQTL